MTCNFRVGQKVVCVDNSWVGPSPLVKGGVYTIVRIVADHGFCVNLNDYLRTSVLVLRETANPTSALGFHQSRFRPAVERGTDAGMSILRNLLNKADKPVEVEA